LYKCIDCVRVPKSLTKKISEQNYRKVDKEQEVKDSIITRLRQELQIKTNARNIIKNDLESFLSEKIKEIETKTRELIKEELSSTTKNITEASKKTYAEITTEKAKEIRKIVTEQNDKDNHEKTDIESRKRNIIIHGMREDIKTEERTHQEDEEDIQSLLKDIDVALPPLTHHRIGIPKKDKHRPIKVSFQKESDKVWVMKNLYKLKDVPYIPRFSITEDFTSRERKKIKELHEEAKQRNSLNTDQTFVWRVRGNPRTSLRLAKISQK